MSKKKKKTSPQTNRNNVTSAAPKPEAAVPKPDDSPELSLSEMFAFAQEEEQKTDRESIKNIC